MQRGRMFSSWVSSLAETRVASCQPRRRSMVVVLGAVVLLATGCRTGTVTRVIDGDTVDVNGVRVRVIGYDTPERGQCGYSQATARARQLVGNKKVVVLDVPGRETHDQYGRELAYIHRNDFDLGRVLISEGLAHARYDGLDGYQPHPLQDEYRALDAATPNLCGTSPPPTIATTAPPATTPAGTCHPDYWPCLAVTNDLNCVQIGHKVRVIRHGIDPYGLDADYDGVGCESYPTPPGW